MNLTATVDIRERDIRERNTHGNGALPAGSHRHRALARLYERRAAVDQLIDALERYQRDQRRRPEQAKFEEFNAIAMSS
jgi:hypothetical protein